MYTLTHAEPSVKEVHVCGRSKNIKEIDLAVVFFTKEDKETLALITSFDLSHNCIEHLQHLDALISLTRLNVSNNRVALVGSLPLTITHLDLAHNQLTSLEGIGRLPHLRELNVNYNRLKNVMGLTHSQPLQVLRMEGNRIVSTVGLEGMSKLRFLMLDHNLIDNTNELLFLSSTASLEILSIRENPVAIVDGYRALVAHLQPAVLSLDGLPLMHRDGLPLQGSGVAALNVEDTTTKNASSSSPVPEAFTCTAPLVACSSTNTAHDARATNGVVRTGESPPCLKCEKTAAMGVVVLSEDVVEDSVAHTSHRLQGQKKKNHLQPQQQQQQRNRQRSQAESSFGGELSKKNVLAEKVIGEPSTAELTVAATLPTSKDTKRELHATQLLLEEMKKENEYLRTRNRTLVAQLKESRRVVSSQLGEISELREKLTAVVEREAMLKQRVDRMKRNALAVNRYTHDTVDAVAMEKERIRALYEVQIADLRKQLRLLRSKEFETDVAVTTRETQKPEEKPKKYVEESRLLQQCHLSPPNIDANDSSLEVQEVVMDEEANTFSENGNDDFSSPLPGDVESDPKKHHDARAADIGKLAGDLKNWLYSEMAEDARQIEENIVSQLRQSLNMESSVITEEQC